jgi:hypothetical protein
MRFLADENFPGAAVKALEALGHDVVPPPHANHYCVVARVADAKALLSRSTERLPP